ncbi:MAG TPA: hypothetical protein VEL71_07520 [Candidatus Dormibacteraeota bacterium]|nr:hypothetical protein [Candidatus Dormibacteraeota bacterium]
MVRTIQSPREIALMVSRSLSSDEERKQQERRGRKLLREMEDPIKVISGVVRKT